MPTSSRSCAPESRGQLPHPRSSPRCVRTRAAPAQVFSSRNATRWQPMQNETPSGHPALKLLHHRRHRCCQRRWLIDAVQHQVPNLCSQSPQIL
jgi:hypothetical protein